MAVVRCVVRSIENIVLRCSLFFRHGDTINAVLVVVLNKYMCSYTISANSLNAKGCHIRYCKKGGLN